MSTQQTEALPALIERFRGLHFDHAPDGWPAVRTREITALLDRITELESQLAQRFDAADMATAAAQGFRDGVASLSANAGEPRNAIDRDALIDAIAQGLHGTWHCTRVWEAWHVGTMSQDDFEPVDESETPTEIADAVLALLAAPTPQAAQPAPATQQAGATKEHVRLVRVIADKIEDGTLFRSGIYSNKDLARFVRNVADAAAPQFPTTQAQADSVPAVSDLPPLPAPDLRDVGTKPQEIKEFLKGYATEYARTAIAARAPADSVQEDAAQRKSHAD